MMSTIVDEKLISFKELEKKVFKYVCELGCEITKTILESYDKELSAQRDTKKYRDKGTHRTSIKTVYGTVEYRRTVYRITLEDGTDEQCLWSGHQHWRGMECHATSG